MGLLILLVGFGIWFFQKDPVADGLNDLARTVAQDEAARPAPRQPQAQTRSTPPARPTQPPARPVATATPTTAAPQAQPPTTPPASPPATPPTAPPAGTPSSPPLGDANGPSLWNVPFVGHSNQEIAAEMRKRYAGRKPKLWAEKMPGITSRITPEPTGDHPVIALTLDACSGAYDAELITFLRQRQIPATIFVTGRWLKDNPDTFKDLAKDPLFEIGAHGMAHKPCSVDGREAYNIKGTASMQELVDEVESNARELHRAGTVRPRWFRSGTAFYDDVAVAVIHDLGMNVAGYSIAIDEGATLPAAKVRDKTLAAKNGDILLGHMNHPSSGTRQGLMDALPVLLDKGYVFIRLSGR